VLIGKAGSVSSKNENVEPRLFSFSSHILQLLVLTVLRCLGVGGFREFSLFCLFFFYGLLYVLFSFCVFFLYYFVRGKQLFITSFAFISHLVKSR